MQRQRCESIGTDRAQDRGVERGVSRESAIEISVESVVPRDLVEQLEDEARTKPMDTLDMPFTLQTAGLDSLLVEPAGA
jgi:hypothetical protein